MEEYQDVKVEVVSLKGHIKAIAVAVLFVLAMSVGCVFLYHILVTKSLKNDYNGKFLKMEQDISKTVYSLDGDIQDLRNSVAKIVITQDIINHLSAEILLIQSTKIKTLERRHLEVIRALAILQKNHWSEKKRLESSGLVGDDFEWEAWLKAAKTPEGQSIKDSEKVIKNW